MFVQDCNKKSVFPLAAINSHRSTPIDYIRSPLDVYYENYFTATAEENSMATLLPVFERFDVCDHWNLHYIHLIILGWAQIDISTYLSISKENIDVMDSFGRTALMWAAWRGDALSFSTLLRFGANVQACSFDGNSVLIYAAYGGSKECLRLLLDGGADINHTSRKIVTPAMVPRRIGDSLVSAKVRCVRGATIEASQRQRFTPLYVAALTNQVESLMYLLECGASIDVTSWKCSTPLSIAVSQNSHRVVEELIKTSSDLSASASFEASYLTYVGIFGDERTIRLFIDARPAINTSLKDSQGLTAQEHFCERLRGTGPMDVGKERLAAAFQQLVDICSEEFERAQGGHQLRLQEIDEHSEDPSEAFHDALEVVNG